MCATITTVSVAGGGRPSPWFQANSSAGETANSMISNPKDAVNLDPVPRILLGITVCDTPLKFLYDQGSQYTMILANLANRHGKNDNFARIANKAKQNAMRGPIKVGDTGKFGKYGENDNIATLPNKAKHKAIRGPIKVGDIGEFGKYGENDNIATGQQGKAQSNEGAHKSWRIWQICRK